MLHDTKNGEPRHSPIPDVILTELKKFREIGNGLIFASMMYDDRPFDYKKQWANCMKAADIQDFRWHDMRHDCASVLINDGRSLAEIGQILGHKSAESTMRYAHLSTARKSEVLNSTMNKMFQL